MLESARVGLDITRNSFKDVSHLVAHLLAQLILHMLHNTHQGTCVYQWTVYIPCYSGIRSLLVYFDKRHSCKHRQDCCIRQYL